MKLKEYITQTDDSEVEMVADSIVKQWKDAYRRQMNDMNPEPEEEASPEQLWALNARLQSGASCGAEFAVWFPYHTRVARNTKFDVGQMIEGNRWATREIKGRSSLHYWKIHWRPFEVACISLEAIKPPTARKWKKQIQKWA